MFWLDVLLSLIVIISSFAVTFRPSSLFRQYEKGFKERFWKSREARESSRVASINTLTLGGITLATDAFLLGVSQATNFGQLSTELYVAIGSIFVSAVLSFWAYGLRCLAGLPSSDKPDRGAKMFITGFRFNVGAVYLFYIGILWGLSTLSIWLTIVGFVAYVVAFLIVNTI